jgi:hypothetical protein
MQAYVICKSAYYHAAVAEVYGGYLHQSKLICPVYRMVSNNSIE